MKLTCSRTVLAGAFQTVSGVVPTRTPKPILQNIKLQALPGQLIITGTDQEIGIRYQVNDVNVQRPGEALLPTSRTAAILRELQGEEVTIEVADEVTYIRGERSEYKLGYTDPAEFPAVAEFEFSDYFIVAADQFRQLIRRTVFATDTESTRYALGGVLLDIKDSRLTLAATDTRRLAVARGTCSAHGSPKSENTAPVIPSKAMTLIERSLGGSEEPVWIVIRQNDVLVRSGPTTLYSRLVEGRFPRYEDVIPKQSEITVDLVAGPFHSAVRQAQIVTSDESRGVDFRFAAGLLTLTSAAAEVGQSKIELPIALDQGDLSIVFDPRYVSDFLKVLPPEQALQLELQDSDSAALFKTMDGYQYIVMPLAKDQ